MEVGQRVLIAARDVGLMARAVSALARDRFAIDTAHTGSDALATLGNRECDLLIIGGNLLDVSGLELLRRARLLPRAQSSSEAPGHAAATMLLLEPTTTHGSWPPQAELDAARRIAALTAGADDVISAPVNDEELRLRAAALLRRRSRRTDDRPRQAVSLGPLRVDLEAVTVASHGRRLQLTRSEFRLLRALILRPGAVLARAELKDALWGDGDPPSSRALTVHVSRLRLKLVYAGVAIDAMPGRGYRLRQLVGSLRSRTALPR